MASFSKVGQRSRSRSQVHNLWYHWKGLVIRITHAKYGRLISKGKKVMPNVKVFLTDRQTHTGIFKGCGYSSRLWLQFLKDVATGKNGQFAREFSGKSTTNAHFTEIMLSMPI